MRLRDDGINVLFRSEHSMTIYWSTLSSCESLHSVPFTEEIVFSHQGGKHSFSMGINTDTNTEVRDCVNLSKQQQ